MHEILSQVFSYVWGAWRHRWLALIVAWVVAIGGWIWVWQLPEAYVAKARIYVDTNSVLRPLLRGLTVQPDINQRITMLSRTLLSRPNLEKLTRMTDLDLDINSDQQKEDMFNRLAESISLSGDRTNSSLYSISVRDEDRGTARRVAQSLITVFIESSLGEKRQDSTGAQNFLDDQIKEYERRLVSAENRLAEFKKDNVDVLPGGGSDYYSRLQAMRLDLSEATLQLNEMENRRLELRRQLEGEEPMFMASPVTGMQSASPLDARIQVLQSRADGLLSSYTSKHPEVVQIRGLIRELEAEKAKEYSRIDNSSTSEFSSISNNPVYQGMRTMLAQTEATVAELQVRVAEYGNRVQILEEKVNNIPEIEAKLKQLDRDYAVISGQHQQLLQRRESARLSQDVEQNASDVTFRVIDPPFVPLHPSDPNKILLNAGVLLVALGAGIGAALLGVLVSPVVTDPRTLTKLAGLPFLGSVSLVQPPEERRRELIGLISFAAITAAFLLTYVGVTLSQGNLFS